MHTYLCPYLLIKLMSDCYELYFRGQKNHTDRWPLWLLGTACCSIDQSVVVCGVHEPRERSLDRLRKYNTKTKEIFSIFFPSDLPLRSSPPHPHKTAHVFYQTRAYYCLTLSLPTSTSCNIGISKTIPKPLRQSIILDGLF